MSYKSDIADAVKEIDSVDSFLRRILDGKTRPTDDEIRSARRAVDRAKTKIDDAERSAKRAIRDAKDDD